MSEFIETDLRGGNRIANTYHKYMLAKSVQSVANMKDQVAKIACLTISFYGPC